MIRNHDRPILEKQQKPVRNVMTAGISTEGNSPKATVMPSRTLRDHIRTFCARNLILIVCRGSDNTSN